MGLWDRLRGREESADDGVGPEGEPDPEWFTPRLGATYGADNGDELVFGTATVTLARPGRVPLRGEWSTSGRFTTLATFERPVVFTVEEPSPTDPSVADSFNVRRTDTAESTSSQVQFRRRVTAPTA